jgi:hypothetical protein
MVGVAVDHASPFDRRSSVLLDPGHQCCCRLLEIRVRVFGGQDDLEDALISGLLPSFSQRTELVLLRQAKPVWGGNLAADCYTRLFLSRHAVAFGAFALDVCSMRFPTPRRPGGRVADIHDGAALEGR